MEAFASIEHDRVEWTDQTRRGLILLLIGVIVNAIPIVRAAGSFVAVAGAVLLLEGRHLYGRNHTVHIVGGMIVLAIGTACAIVASVGYLLYFYAVPTYYPGNSVILTAIIQLLPIFFLWDCAGSISIALGYSILAYPFQRLRGKIVLLSGLVLSLFLSVEVFTILNSSYQSLAAFFGIGVFPGQGYFRLNWDLDAASAFEGQILAWGAVGLVPAVVFAYVLYTAYRHIGTEVPPEQVPSLHA